jgi:dTMP kinase
LANLIVFEGIDGSGTTTQSRLLHDVLKQDTFWDKEPTEGDIGRMIQEILRQDGESVNPLTLLQLFLADRVEHQKTIEEELKNGNSVILDRYVLSTMAYQGIYFEIPDLYRLNENFIKPDIVFFIDLQPEIGLERKTGKKELFENLETLNRVREKYFQAIDFLKVKGWNIVLLEGSEPMEKIHDQVIKHLKDLKNVGS